MVKNNTIIKPKKRVLYHSPPLRYCLFGKSQILENRGLRPGPSQIIYRSYICNFIY